MSEVQFRPLAKRHGITFLDCLSQAIYTPELLAKFDKLYGTALVADEDPINAMIDEATGRKSAEFEKFSEFCWEYLFTRFGTPSQIVWPTEEEVNEFVRSSLEKQ